MFTNKQSHKITNFVHYLTHSSVDFQFFWTNESFERINHQIFCVILKLYFIWFKKMTLSLEKIFEAKNDISRRTALKSLGGAFVAGAILGSAGLASAQQPVKYSPEASTDGASRAQLVERSRKDSSVVIYYGSDIVGADIMAQAISREYNISAIAVEGDHQGYAELFIKGKAVPKKYTQLELANGTMGYHAGAIYSRLSSLFSVEDNTAAIG